MSQRISSQRGALRTSVSVPSAPRRPLAVALALALLASAVGCKPGAKGSPSASPAGPAAPVKVQCDKLVQTVQQGRAKFDATQDSADFEKDTRRSALLLQELRDDIGRSGTQDEGLKKIASDYQAALSLAASDLTALATAAKGSDDKKFQTISNQFDAHWQAATAVDKKLNDYCAGK